MNHLTLWTQSIIESREESVFEVVYSLHFTDKVTEESTKFRSLYLILSQEDFPPLLLSPCQQNPNSLGTEVIRSQTGIVDLQDQAGIVNGGGQDLGMRQA